MSNTNTGGPAFPEVRIISGDNYNAPTKVYYGGMTLRDYFAAKAMQGLISAGAGLHKGDENEVGEFAYTMADAMLATRSKA